MDGDQMGCHLPLENAGWSEGDMIDSTLFPISGLPRIQENSLAFGQTDIFSS